MSESIAIFATVNFTVVGLSHICQVQAWREFVQKLHSMGEAGAFANGMITLFMGSLIVSFHNIWTGVPVILTLIGWVYILKSTAIFVCPQWNLRSMKNLESNPTLKLRIAGTVMLGVALTILLSIAFGQYS